jgi:hypothetical protein
MRFNKYLFVAMACWALCAAEASAQTSETNERLKQALEKHPEADANKDGVLTLQEAIAFQQRLPAEAKASGDAKIPKSLTPLNTQVFRVTAEELNKLMQADNAANARTPLSFKKGEGLRVLMTGHSWVGPARKTLLEIAGGAGLDGHHQREHTSGGGTGSANSIWRKEIGKYDQSPARPILLPAIATGQWDVMTWGAFYGDTPEHYQQWIDV